MTEEPNGFEMKYSTGETYIYTGEILRVGDSGKVHISKDGQPVCNMFDADEKENVESADAASASKFFDLCPSCEECYDPKTGKTTREMREEIAEAMGIPLGESDSFNATHVRAFYELIITGDYLESAQDIAPDSAPDAEDEGKPTPTT